MCMPKPKKIEQEEIEVAPTPPPAPSKSAQGLKGAVGSDKGPDDSDAAATIKAKKKGRRSLRIKLDSGVKPTKSRGLNIPGGSSGANVPAG